MDPQLAYLAGLFDRVGTFSIQIHVKVDKHGTRSVQFAPRMTLNMTRGVEIIDELVQCFGGHTYSHARLGRQWCLGKREALQAAAGKLLPYLRTKQRVAEQFLEALEIFPKQRKVHRNGERSWTLEMVQRVARIALTINAKKGPENIKRLKVLENVYKGVA